MARDNVVTDGHWTGWRSAEITALPIRLSTASRLPSAFRTSSGFCQGLVVWRGRAKDAPIEISHEVPKGTSALPQNWGGAFLST